MKPSDSSKPIDIPFVAESANELLDQEGIEILRETPSERACSVLEGGFLMWPSRVRKLVLIDDPTAPVMGADETL